MKKQLLLAIGFLFSLSQASAQTDRFWTEYKGSGVEVAKQISREDFPKQFKLFSVNVDQMRQVLFSAQDRFVSKQGKIISLPNSDGGLEQFEMFEASNFDAELQAQFPDIRAYVGKGINDKYAQIRLSVSPKGLDATIFRAGKDTELLEQYSNDGKVYAIYTSKSQGAREFKCGTVENSLQAQMSDKNGISAKSNDRKWHVFRLAMSCTGEYAAFHGGTTALVLAAFNNTMSRVNGVFEKEFGIHMNLVASTTNVIYLNAGTDPYGDTDANYNTDLQDALTINVGDANYDIGHLVSAIGNNGNAGCIGCVCGTADTTTAPWTGVGAGKGSGYTTSTAPIGDNFDIDFVAHEMGHQFGANHTFTFSGENNTVNVEPGSGSSIMGYAGITGAYDVQPHSDDYFTYRSINQVQTNMTTKTCQTTTNVANLPPVVTPGANLTLPIGTPFYLTGSITDPNGNPVTYCWEQNDDATTVGGNAGFVLSSKNNGPNFRSYAPTTSPVRYFPSLSALASNRTTFEVVPTIARTLNFALTGRDNVVGQYQTSTATMSVTFDATRGPLDVTSQNTDGISWLQNSTQTITWTVNNTNLMAGAANVDILLSTDGGLTYPIVLLANTLNDGSQAITVPNIAATDCRIMVKASGNVFFDVNRKPIAIGYTVTNTCNTYTNNGSIDIPDGSGTTGPIPGGYALRTVNVPVTYNITDVNVNVAVTHTYINDLAIELAHPDATSLWLWLDFCASQNNFNITFDDNNPIPVCTGGSNATGPSGVSYAPYDKLSVLNGKPANGTWTLGARDLYSGDTGSVTNFAVTVCSQTLTLSNPDFEFEDFNLYPNPNKGEFTIKFTSSTANDIKVVAHDLRGRQVYEKSFVNTGAINQSVSLNNVESGIYLVSIIDGAKKTVKRVIIE
ncbi:zinc-dependent metalloprotease [Flavobacterium terrae]|uniref:Por secretion system C-terminal sorting domain-containing protein n=1 Tax=Flavobacterium terrae TaxID=415425 RepID=A0A1M6AFU4_9FLAO|nr:zinc-dependent metalloprotease [Flavobacterium terrae]SHI35416.1 Por secretion system C-terminal sorting domain-containing protein [Flavobacterium terrae]